MHAARVDDDRGESSRGADAGGPVLEHRSPSSIRSRVVAQILEAATHAVAERGLNGLSMEDIAMRAGCSRATVYRRVGGKDAIRDAVLGQAIARITASVAQLVDHLDGRERIAAVIVAALDTIRTDAVSAALLTSAATGESVGSEMITQFNDVAAELAGLRPDDRIGCELITRMTLSLLCWPAIDRRTELAMIRRYVGRTPKAPQWQANQGISS